jgi:hypothetical protein
MEVIVRKLVTVLLAITMFAGGIYIEGTKEVEAVTALEQEIVMEPNGEVLLVRDGEGVNVTNVRKLLAGDEIQTKAGEALLKFDDHGEIRILNNATFKILGHYENGFVFNLKDGHIWINSLYTSSGLNVLAGAALMVPDKAVIDLQFNGENTKVTAVNGHVNVGLIDSSYNAQEVVNIPDVRLINNFLIAHGGKADINFSKVAQNSETIKKLLYSKLIKEFNYSLFDKKVLKEDQWFKDNISKDNQLLAVVEKNKSQKIHERNLKYASIGSLGYELDQLIYQVGNYAIFIKEKQKQRLMNHIMAHLLDAEYLFSYGRNKEAQERISIFEKLIKHALVENDETFKSDLFGMVRREYDRLNFVTPRHSLFEVKNSLSEIMISLIGNEKWGIKQKIEFARNYMNYAFILANVNELEARLTIDNYFIRLRDLLKTHANESDIRNFLAEENQIMDSLLKQYPQFYKDNIFAMKTYIETEWLKLLDEGALKVEERQTIISGKIDFLKNLQFFFLNQTVALEDARLIALRLINEIRDLQGGNEVAVNQLFALRLKDYGNFLRFLNTTSVTTLRGSSPQKKYDEFLDVHKEQVSIEQAINEFGGIPEKSSTTVKSVMEQIEKDFASVGVTGLKIGEMRSIEQKVVFIERGFIEKNEFSALYDWSKKLLLEVRADGKLLNQGSVRMASLPLLFPKKQISVPLPKQETEVTQEQTSDVSKIEKVALILFMQKLSANGFEVKEENIKVVEVEQQIFDVFDIQIKGKTSLKLNFSYNNKLDIVKDLEVKFKNDIKTTIGTFKLSEVVKKTEELISE